MDLEVVGRHALLFDDDPMAAFVNSGDALVDWNSLQIDRYDVRHLLSGPLPPRRRRITQSSAHLADLSVNSELDRERYLDLPPPSNELEVEEAEKPGDSAYQAVAFSYGTDNSVDQSNADVGSRCPKFQPPFPVPENLLHRLPSTEKVHQIIARTAMFVSKNGGQSEIILRVKQGDNPTFGFLMPDHDLHAYFRLLVDHQELLQSKSDGETQSVGNNANQKNLGAGGALSLLGSVYGSGEDEDSVMEETQEIENVASGKTNAASSTVSHVSGKTESSANAARKDEIVAKYPIHSKEKPSAVKKNPSIAASKVGSTSGMKKEDVSGLCAASLEKLEEPLILEPPPDLKILVDKIVDFILKTGNQFEAALREQDSKHGRFPFLVPSNQYHPYYLKVLQNSQESKEGAKNSLGKDDSVRPGLDKKAPSSKEEDGIISKFSNVPYESDRKEKFKMIIGESKKNLLDQPLKDAQEPGISIDAEAAALQAATRGLMNPYAGITSCSSFIRSSQPHGADVKQGPDLGPNSLVPNAKAIVKATVSETVSQHDSDLHLTKELKLKAERLKRAKMFVAMLKSGAVPSKDEPLRAFSVEPLETGISISPAEVNHEIKLECSNSDLVDINTSDNKDNGGKKFFREECHERRSRRKYRSRSQRCEDSDQEEMEQNNSEDQDIREKNYKYSRKKHQSVVEERNRKHSRKMHHSDEEERNHKHSRKKHSSRQDSDYAEEHKKEKSHRSSRKRHQSHHSSHEDNDGEKNADSSSHRHSRKKHSSHRHKREEDDKKVQKRSRKKRQSHRTSHQSEGSPRTYSSGDEGSQLRKYGSSSGNEDGHYDMGAEKKKGLVLERGELEEGEISPKLSDQSKSLGARVSRETSADIASTNGRASSQHSEATVISDDLRAKIRAMLMTTM